MFILQSQQMTYVSLLIKPIANLIRSMCKNAKSKIAFGKNPCMPKCSIFNNLIFLSLKLLAEVEPRIVKMFNRSQLYRKVPWS